MNRTIFITGGGGKLGRVFVRHFLEQGDTIITCCRSKNGIVELEDQFKEHSENLIVLQSDLSAPGAIANLVGELDELGLQPDCLVNNARDVKHLKTGNNGKVSRENFVGEFVMDVVVPYELTIALSEQRDNCLKFVVNIGSQYGTVAVNPNLYDDPRHQSPLQYGVCKAALAHLTKELAVRLAQRKILVNCVAFGGVEGRVDENFKKRYAELVPLGRMLREEEVIGPVDQLMSDNFSAMTGHILCVDGGWSIW